MRWKDSDNARQAAKMRVCLWPSLAVLALVQDGIEKVRGSTPLISTNRFRVQNKGFSGFLVSRRPTGERVGKCILQHFTTLPPVALQGGKCAYMKLKQTGTVFDNHGLWYYSVQLPGEKKRRLVPLRAPGSKHTMRSDRPRKMAEEAAARYWEEHTRQAARHEPATGLTFPVPHSLYNLWLYP